VQNRSGDFAERAARYGFLLTLAFFAAAALYGFWLANGMAIAKLPPVKAADAALADAGYKIEAVSFSGVRYTPRSLIDTALDLPHGGSILTYDVEAARQRLQALGWIETAEVRRILPGTLDVSISERQPYARFKDGSKTFVIDRTGVTLGEDVENKYGHLFAVSGPGAPAQAAVLIDELAVMPKIAPKVVQAEFVAGRFWIVTLSNGTTAKLPHKLTDLALSRLDALLASPKIADVQVASFDLRLPHRTILQLRSETPDARDKAAAWLLKNEPAQAAPQQPSVSPAAPSRL
jgi:cell division protein FtsQ